MERSDRFYPSIASVLLTHAYPHLTKDTVDSLRTFSDDRIITLVDAVGWEKFKDFPTAEKGLYHAHKRSPYRNYTLGIQKLYERWPDCDWYLYTEYDCVFVTDKFKEDLSEAAERKAWVVGVDLRRFPLQFPKLFEMTGIPATEHSYYMLGCCHFLAGDFVRRLGQLNFFNTFLAATETYEKGRFPGYTRWAFEEELWPTLAVALGGNLYELSCWKCGEQMEHQSPRSNDPTMFYAGRDHDNWRGKFRKFPIRSSPEIKPDEIYPEVSIVHPVKGRENPVRSELTVRRRMALKKKHLFL